MERDASPPVAASGQGQEAEAQHRDRRLQRDAQHLGDHRGPQLRRRHHGAREAKDLGGLAIVMHSARPAVCLMSLEATNVSTREKD